MTTAHETTSQQRVTAALDEAGISQELRAPRPRLTGNAGKVLERRYLSKDPEGHIVEDMDGMFRRVAHNLSQADLGHGATEEERQATEHYFYDAMRGLDLLPNSPTLMNAGRELQQLSGCFVLPVADSLDDIFEAVKRTALIHKSGGGTGFSFSRLRPEGDVVGSTGGVASGPTSFIRAFDTATDVIKQGGTRRGANMAVLRVDHPDVLKFIHSKEDNQSLANFNISVAATDEFMERVRDGGDYTLVNPHTGGITGSLNAREVFDQIAELAWKTGDPGLVFIDRMNENHPNPHLGRIEGTNPCAELPMLPYESCNLASINLARMVNDGGVDWEHLQRTVHLAVHLLDNVIDMNSYPMPEIEEMTKQTRRIGLGVMGFADMAVQLGVAYDSREALTLMHRVMERVQSEAHLASLNLSVKRGSYPAWTGSTYTMPMRHTAPTTIAPTGTISIIAGVSSGIEPLFALTYKRNVMDNDHLDEVNPYFEAVARHEGFYSEDLMRDLAKSGSARNLDVPEWVKVLFPTSHDISPEWHVKMQAAAQAHVDNAVSKTINFPHTATVDEVREAYLLAYELKCKGITVYRDGSKDKQVLSTGASTSLHGDESVPAHALLTPRARPRALSGVTELVETGHGNMYVTINFDENGQPFEVFGNLGKTGGCDSAQIEAICRMASLSLRSGVDPRAIVDQLKGIICCPIWDHGVKVNSTPDAVALTLEKHIKGSPSKPTLSTGMMNGNGNGHSQGVEAMLLPKLTRLQCPECREPVVYRDGCNQCVSCGWSRCD